MSTDRDAAKPVVDHVGEQWGNPSMMEDERVDEHQKRDARLVVLTAVDRWRNPSRTTVGERENEHLRHAAKLAVMAVVD
jgi:hypothetical protein